MIHLRFCHDERGFAITAFVAAFFRQLFSRALPAPFLENDLPVALGFEEFNVLFGPPSLLPLESQRTLFKKYKGRKVVWRGAIVYINLGEGEELFLTLTHASSILSAGVQVRFKQAKRKQLAKT